MKRGGVESLGGGGDLISGLDGSSDVLSFGFGWDGKRWEGLRFLTWGF